MSMASKVKVTGHLRRVGRKVYKVRKYVRDKRPKGRRVKRYIPVGTLEIGHDKYGNIIGNRVIISKPKAIKIKKGVKRMRISPNAELNKDIKDWLQRSKTTAPKADKKLKEDLKDWIKAKVQ